MDTEVKELTVMPWRLVAPSKVTMATPVANLPRLPRKWCDRGAEVRPAADGSAAFRESEIITDPQRSTRWRAMALDACVHEFYI
jgi:hypothetical protein